MLGNDIVDPGDADPVGHVEIEGEITALKAHKSPIPVQGNDRRAGSHPWSRRRAGGFPALYVRFFWHVTGAVYSCERGGHITQMHRFSLLKMTTLLIGGGARGGELLRTPLWRSSQNIPSTHSGE
jgi:hypothetical protein